VLYMYILRNHFRDTLKDKKYTCRNLSEFIKKADFIHNPLNFVFKSACEIIFVMKFYDLLSVFITE
jgi:hypothetical protein